MSPRVASMSQFRGSRIGILTVPRQRIEPTEDAALLQRALTAPKRSFDRNDVIAMTGGLAVIVLVMAAGWIGWLA